MLGESPLLKMSARIQAEKEVFNEYFNTLVTSIQCCVLEITNDCLSKTLICPATHRQIIHDPATPGTKATTLLTAIRDGIGVQRESSVKRFLTVLGEQIIFSELIMKFDESLEEVINRKKTAECEEDLQKYETNRLSTDARTKATLLSPKKQWLSLEKQQRSPKQQKLSPEQQWLSPKQQQPSPKQQHLSSEQKQLGTFERVNRRRLAERKSKFRVTMIARQSVIKQHLPEMKKVVEGLITPIASKCVTKQIITKEFNKNVIRPTISKERRTKKLLHNVCKCVRTNKEKFDDFLGILDNHSACKQLIKNIKKSLRQLEDQEVYQALGVQKVQSISQPDSPLQRSSHSSMTISAESCSDDIPAECSPVTIVSGRHGDEAKTVTLLQSGTVSKSAEAKYYSELDKQQDRAVMDDLQSQNENLRMKKQQNEMEIVTLRRELNEKEREVHDLREEVGTFQHCMERVNLKMSEKRSHTGSEITTEELKKIISKNEKKIDMLEKEKREVENNLKLLNENFKILQEQFRTNQATLNDTQKGLQETQKELKNAVQFLGHHSKSTTWNWKTVSIIIIIVLTTVIFLSIFLMLFYLL